MYRILTVVSIVLLSGCVESYFRLSEESRLPYFFEIAKGKTRQQYDMTAAIHIWPSGVEAVLKLDEKDSWFGGKRIVAKKTGGVIILKGQKEEYPTYGIVRYQGITDIIEHRGRNDIIFMTDDPKVWKELGLSKP
jgi:hypothetical protein